MSPLGRHRLAALPPGQRRVLEAFYAGDLPAGQLCAALDAAAIAAPDAPRVTAARLAPPATVVEQVTAAELQPAW